MPFELPPIVKLAERVLLEVELVVRGFPRYHKYTIGSELREQARNAVRYAHRAWRDQARRPEWTGKLAFAIDDLKLSLQLGKQVQAFKSFRQFEVIARLAAELGRQCGGWRKQQSKGQNARPAAEPSSAQRPQILSSRDASQEASL
jgi:hypothetical protein